MGTILKRADLFCSTFLLLACGVTAVAGEWDTASTAYGRGVHAFFSGRLNEAEAWLNQAADFNPNDPRIFYFRALTLKRLGRGDEACSDFEFGAAIEAESPNRYAVGTALQRVQGADRLVLEKYRRQSRAGAAAYRQLVHAERANRTFNDFEVLYHPVVVPLEEFGGQGEPRALTSEELKLRAQAAEKRAANKNAVAPADPFRDDSADGRASADLAPAAEDEALQPKVAEPDAAPAVERSQPPASAEPADDEDPFSDF